MSALRVTEVFVQSSRNPLGLDDQCPRFRWILESGVRGQVQSAYQVCVSLSKGALRIGKADVWDSGTVASSCSVGVAYSGPALMSRMRYYWKVRVWDRDGQPSAWSSVAWFETGFLGAGDWFAEWVTHSSLADGSAVQFRREFSVPSPVTRARIYSSALGTYRLELNGALVSADRFAPGWTDYRRRIQYQTYDVTALLRPGRNAVGAIVAAGWYAGRIGTYGRQIYGRHPALLIQLEITCSGGLTIRVITDEAWRGMPGPVISADLLDGETYDARRETSGWSRPGFDDSQWTPAKVHPGVPGSLLTAQKHPPVRVIDELEPVRSHSPVPGVRVFDMGQNMVGTVRLSIAGGRAGSVAALRFGELLDRNGCAYTANLRTACATDHYILKGAAREAYEPACTVHGFRYVEIRAPDIPLDMVTIVGLVLSASAPRTGEFSSSSAMLNRLHGNIVWSQRGNFLSIPTDCPQRDERLGWTGDMNVFAPTAVFNMDCSRFLGKWLADVRDAIPADGAVPDVAPSVPGIGGGNSGWGDAIVTVPYALWQAYGDPDVILENYPAMMQWIDYLVATSNDCLRPASGWGDWHIDGSDTRIDLVNTACFARSVSLAGQMAAAIGRADDAARLQELTANIRDAFARAFVTEDGHLREETQAGYVLSLASDLLPAESRQRVAGRLVHMLAETDWRLSTGSLATSEILSVLGNHGYVDAAYRLLNGDDCPSWGYAISRGATTMWEHWDAVTPDGGLRDPAMNSLNHYAQGAVGKWIYRSVLGIDADPDVPGYGHIIIRPRPGGGLTSASGSFDSVRGVIAVGWELSDHRFAMSVRVPVNARASIYVPSPRGVHACPAGAGEGVDFIKFEEGYSVFQVGSGRYRFVTPG